MIWYTTKIKPLGDTMDASTNHPATKTEARAIGATFYYTGKSCIYGHTAPRYTCNSVCKTCQYEKVEASRSGAPSRRRRVDWTKVQGRWIKIHEPQPGLSADNQDAFDPATETPYNKRTAKLANSPYFTTGRACSLGHKGLRYASSGACVECTKERATARRWGMSPEAVENMVRIKADRDTMGRDPWSHPASRL